MIQVVGKGMSPLCFLPSGKLVCYSKGDILVMEQGCIIRKMPIFMSAKEKILGRCRYLYRLLRLGVRAALAVAEDKILLSVGNSIYELELSSGELSEGYFCGEGTRPLSFTDVRGLSTVDDGIYFGGYLRYHNKEDKKPASVYKRVAKDSWKVVYTFPQGVVNHIHTVVCDPYRDCMWIYTGDFGEAAAIWKVTDNFRKVERCCCNEQKYRGCVVFPLPEGLLYATDSPLEDDFIYLMNPEDFSVKTIAPIAGSCIYGCQWRDKYVFSTTVEGNGEDISGLDFLFGRKRGDGIKDEYVHLYVGDLNEGFREIYKEKKDWLPFCPFQFGVIRFPYGMNNGSILYFQPVATNGNDLGLMKITV